MKYVNVRIKYGGQVISYECGDLNPVLGDWVVVRDGELIYLGQVTTNPTIWSESGGCFDDETQPLSDKESKASLSRRCNEKPSKDQAMLRIATPADLARQAENEVHEREAFEYCLARVGSQKLDMKLVAVEVAFDASKTVFYYTADDRVDFRLLVKELVSRFRTRIEMRQIGARHESRMVGGLGGCGRCFCCSGFLANFAPVSVKMAKEQNMSLSPAKISGICGRLMCCLAFEHCEANNNHKNIIESPADGHDSANVNAGEELS